MISLPLSKNINNTNAAFKAARKSEDQKLKTFVWHNVANMQKQVMLILENDDQPLTTTAAMFHFIFPKLLVVLNAA